MSDDDSDWGSEHDDAPAAGAPPPPRPPPAAPVVPKAPLTPLPAALQDVESQALPPQQVFLGTPVQLTSSSGKTQVAGATVLHTVADNSWKIFLYDSAQKPAFLEPITSETDKSKKYFTAPCLFELQEGAFATMVDSLKRGWKLQFQDRAQSFRMLVFICIAQAAVRAQQGLPPSCLVDMVRGAEKGCKPKHMVECTIRGWRVQMNNGGTTHSGPANLTQPLPPHLANFNPTFTDTSSIFCAEVQVAAEEPVDAEVPTTLGQVVGKMGVDGQRLLVCPASSPLCRTLTHEHCSEHRTVVCRDGYFLLLFVQVTAIGEKQKKKKDKEKKEKKDKPKVLMLTHKEEEVKAAPEPQRAPEPVTKKELPEVRVKEIEKPKTVKRDSMSEEEAPPVSIKPPREPLFPMGDTAPKMDKEKDKDEGLRSLEENIKSLASTQMKIVKALVGKAFEGISKELSLVATIEDPEPVAAQKLAHKTAVRQQIVNVASQFEQANKEDVTGTIRNVLASFKKFGASFEAREQGETTSKQAAKQIADLQAQVKKLEAEKKSAVNQLALVGEKQMQLADEHLALEEKNSKLKKEVEELTKKTTMCEVFEKGLADMRRLLGDETAEKNKLQASLQDLLQLQRGYKLTWVPDKYATHCMKCNEKFKMYGSKSKGHCRYCGRLFCQDCCTVMELPEYGYSGKVKVCTPCYEFKHKSGEGKGDD